MPAPPSWKGGGQGDRAKSILAQKSVGSDLVLCIVRVDMAPKIRVPKANWLLVLWRRAADVLMQDSGDQALIGQIFLGSSPL